MYNVYQGFPSLSCIIVNISSKKNILYVYIYTCYFLFFFLFLFFHNIVFEICNTYKLSSFSLQTSSTNSTQSLIASLYPLICLLIKSMFPFSLLFFVLALLYNIQIDKTSKFIHFSKNEPLSETCT